MGDIALVACAAGASGSHPVYTTVSLPACTRVYFHVDQVYILSSDHFSYLKKKKEKKRIVDTFNSNNEESN